MRKYDREFKEEAVKLSDEVGIKQAAAQLLPKANPMLQEIKSEHDLAYGSGDPAKIREWLIKRCNLWQEGSTDKYMDGCMDKWKAAEVSREEFATITKGLACLSGEDLSKRLDLTGQAFLFKLRDGRYALKAHGFIPDAAITKHEHSDRMPQFCIGIIH